MSRTVTLDYDDAQVLLRCVLVQANGVDRDQMLQALGSLVIAVEQAPPEPSLIDEFRTGWRAGSERARPKPQWANVAKAVRVIRDLYDNPASTATADALGAYIRDRWDDLGLSLHDEETLYVAVTTVALMVEMAHNGMHAGAVEPDVVANMAHVAQSFTASVIPWLPPAATA